MTLEVLEHKEIDSIIDEGKASGLYSIAKLNIQTENEEPMHIDDVFPNCNSSETVVCNVSQNTEESANSWENVPDVIQTERSVRRESLVRSDSEVTVIRVRKERLQLNKLTCNQWAEIHDLAVPGDGTHLGESPSLVNLVTFVTSNSDIKKEAGEYLIPISTWNPIYIQSKNIQQDDIKLNASNSDTKSQSPEPDNMQVEEIHRSLQITRLSNSRLNIPYMMKQKLSPRPGALFSTNVAISNKLESEKILMDKINNNENQDDVQMIKAPPEIKRRTFSEKLRSFLNVTFCACCLSNSIHKIHKEKNSSQNTRKKNLSANYANFLDTGVQTTEDDSEIF